MVALPVMTSLSDSLCAGGDGVLKDDACINTLFCAMQTLRS